MSKTCQARLSSYVSLTRTNIQSNMSMHHYKCVALCFVNILQ